MPLRLTATTAPSTIPPSAIATTAAMRAGEPLTHDHACVAHEPRKPIPSLSSGREISLGSRDAQGYFGPMAAPLARDRLAWHGG
jgi:hypothetical protein